jgi:hypothetical protein
MAQVTFIDCEHLGPYKEGEEDSLGVPEGPAGGIFGTPGTCLWISGPAEPHPDPWCFETIGEAVAAYIVHAAGRTTDLWTEAATWASFTPVEKTAALQTFSKVHVVKWPAVLETPRPKAATD